MKTILDYIYVTILLFAVLNRVGLPSYLFFSSKQKIKFIGGLVLMIALLAISGGPPAETNILPENSIFLRCSWIVFPLVLMFNQILDIFTFEKKNFFSSLFWGIVIGTGFAAIFVLFLHPETNYILDSDSLTLIIIIAIEIGFAHEIYYRGFIQGNLIRVGTPALTAIIFQGITYAFTFGDYFPYSMLLHAIFGIALGFLYDKQKNIAGPIVANILAHLIIAIYSYSV